MSIDQIETGSFPQLSKGEDSSRELRIVSWNIARGSRLNAIAQFLHRANPDLILLQEVDKNCRRTGYRNIAKELSDTLRLNYVFGIEFQELAQGSREAPAYHGQVTLSRWVLSNPQILRFCNQSKFWRPSWWTPPLAALQRRMGGRMALVTRISIGNTSLAVYNLHLESRDSDGLRLRQLSEILLHAGRNHEGLPVIAGGDFNVDIEGQKESWTIRETGFRNPFADGKAPTSAPSYFGSQKSIDSILTRGELTTLSAEIHNEVDGSDHYPLSLTVRL